MVKNGNGSNWLTHHAPGRLVVLHVHSTVIIIVYIYISNCITVSIPILSS